MNRKSRFLVALSAFALLGAATPSFAQEGRGASNRDLPGRIGTRVERGAEGPRDQGPRDQGPRDQGQRNFGQQGDGGQRDQVQRNDNQPRFQGNDQRGDDNRQFQAQNRQQATEEMRRRAIENRNAQNDNRGPGPGQRDFGNRGADNRNWNNNNNRPGDNRYGGWNGRDNYGTNYNRYEPNRRAYAAIPYGRYFGRSYGSIASRYYNRNYIYYGSRSWTSWNRPWRIGYALPYSMRCSQLPYDLYYELPPPPYGYDYVMCGYDILLVGYDSRIVIDAILPW